MKKTLFALFIAAISANLIAMDDATDNAMATLEIEMKQSRLAIPQIPETPRKQLGKSRIPKNQTPNGIQKQSKKLFTVSAKERAKGIAELYRMTEQQFKNLNENNSLQQ